MSAPRETLLDFFQSFADLPDEFLIYDDGFRLRRYTYSQTAAAARGFAGKLADAGIGQGDKVLFWSENRPEWIAALWGCLLTGAVAVPVDYRGSAELLLKIHRLTAAKAVLRGEEVPLLPIPSWSLAELSWEGGPTPHVAVRHDDLAEVLFTSGATAEPKGVLITHRNVLANIVPVEREILKYRRYGKPFFPIRFLNLLPLSHLFGQAMATFIPPVLPGVVIFQRSLQPADIARQIRRQRVSVLVCVPKILEVLREYVLRRYPETAHAPAQMHWLRRWWRYRQVHRLFGWKFWSFVVGAAPLPPDLEEYWSRLGFLVIQGYGLTETAPIVTLNHPFHARKGSVGKPIAGVQVQIAPDGEVLVKGENVTSGYYGSEKAAFNDDGWFHTGDIGELDNEGRLLIRGRKKEMIVTPEGLNVFPEDIERKLVTVPGVRDAAIVGRDRPHAVLVLEPGLDPQTIVRTANTTLEEHQKIRGVSVWPHAELPRTSGTGKLKRGEVQKWVEGAGTPNPGGTAPHVSALLARYISNRHVTAATTLEELGLSSLERVELMTALNLGESQIAQLQTIGELAQAAEQPQPLTEEPMEFPSWSRSVWMRALRRIAQEILLLPLTRIFAQIRVTGREHLSDIRSPVLFASNHQSHMDTPVILAALPLAWRGQVYTAMAKEFFEPHFHPERFSWRQRFTNSLNYYLAAMFFAAFPLPQREAGAGAALRYAGELISENWSILLYPEGKRTQAGEIRPFQPGIGMMAAKFNLPVVPVRIVGLDRVLHQTWRMARPGHVAVKFGQPLQFHGEDYQAIAAMIEAAVLAL